jgi:hypothetical protein
VHESRATILVDIIQSFVLAVSIDLYKGWFCVDGGSLPLECRVAVSSSFCGKVISELDILLGLSMGHQENEDGDFDEEMRQVNLTRTFDAE